MWAPCSVSLGGVSKAHGLPGLRVGWLASRDAAFNAEAVAARSGKRALALGRGPAPGHEGLATVKLPPLLSVAAAAGAMGCINSFSNIGGFVGSYITGYLKNLTGSFTLGWIYLAGSLIVSGLLMLTMRRDVDLERS